MKKIACIMAVVLIIFLVISTSTDNQPQGIGGTGGTNNLQQRDLTDVETAVYNIYNADLSGFTPQENYTVMDYLLAKAELSQEAENNITMYKSVSMESILPMCSEITEICKINLQLYVSFTATDGNYITLTFDDEGMVSKDVYMPDTDTYVMIHRNYAYMVKDFRYGK